ncbi:hypothetical protein ACTGVD_11165, partial [Streptococcus suis]
PEQNFASSGYTVSLKLSGGEEPSVVALAGNCFPPVTLLDAGGVRVMPVEELAELPIHALIHVSMVSPQAFGSATQQLWPLETFRTSSDWSGC